MTKKNISKAVIIMLCMAALIGGGILTKSSLAYLSDFGGKKSNKFTVGNVTAEVNEVFNPVTLKTGTNSYKKEVKAKNGGTVPAYMRVWLGFSSGDVEGISKVSCDNGAHWYSLSELKNHLPAGWTYRGTGTLGGYYYYISPIAPGKSTPALITNVKTDFIEKTADTNETINKTVRDYEIFVYTEAVQQMKLDGSGLNTNYSAAWTQFLNKK